MRELIGAIIQANKAFELIEDGDKILVGVSGGKDSTLLLMALNLFKQYIKSKKNWDITIEGVHVKMNYFQLDYQEYEAFLKKQNLKVNFVESDIGDILKAKTKKNQVQCSLCAKLKKAMLVNYATEHGFNKIATGHHGDDAIETLFMNMIHEGRIATFMPKTFFDRNNVYMIRPLILAREREIIRLKNRLNIPVIGKACPRESNTERTIMKQFLHEHFYHHPLFKMSNKTFLIALMNGSQSKLWFDDEKTNKKDLLSKVSCKIK